MPASWSRPRRTSPLTAATGPTSSNAYRTNGRLSRDYWWDVRNSIAATAVGAHNRGAWPARQPLFAGNIPQAGTLRAKARKERGKEGGASADQEFTFLSVAFALSLFRASLQEPEKPHLVSLRARFRGCGSGPGDDHQPVHGDQSGAGGGAGV